MQSDITPIKTTGTDNLNFLSRLYLTLSTDNDPERSISSGLRIIGSHLNTDRLHILAIHHNMTFSILHEWCSQGIPAVSDKQKTHPIIISDTMEAQLNSRSYITINDNNNETDTNLRNLLSTYSCKQILLLPLFGAGSHFAFLSVEQCREQKENQEEEIRLLEISASAIAANIQKNRMIKNLRNQLDNQTKIGYQSDAQISLLNHHIGNLYADWRNFRDSSQASKQRKDNPKLSRFEERLEQLHKLSHPSRTSVI